MPDQLSALAVQHFKHEHNRAAVASLLDGTSVCHLTYPEGPLIAALAVGMVDTGSANSCALSPTWLTYTWLHLRSGQVFMIRLTGDTDHARIDLRDLAALLDDNIESEAEFNTNEKRLNDCLDGCAAKLIRFGLIAPNTDLLSDVNELHGIGRIEALAKDDGSPMIEPMWETFAKHFYGLLNEANPDIAAFTSGLDVDALRLIELITHSYGTDARQVLVYNYFASGSPLRRKYRIQAALQLPWLVPMLTGLQLDNWPLESGPTSAWPGSWTETRQKIIEAIDGGLPLFDLVAHLFHAPRSVIAWTRNRVLPDLTRINHRDIGTLVRLLSAVPAGARPREEAEWQKFDAQLNLYFRIIATTQQIPAFLLPLDWSEDCNQRGRSVECILMNWLADDAALVIKEGADRRNAKWSELEDAMDFISGFSEAVCIRQEQRYGDRRTTRRHHEATMFEWLRSVSLRDIVGMSRIWHRRMVLDAPEPSPEEIEPVTHDEVEWPVLLPEALPIERRIIMQLIDRQSLIDEGDALCHCVGAYDGRCRTGGSAIFSIRSVDGDHLSTLELDLMDSGILTTRAHKAYRNGVPSDDCQLAAFTLIERLNGDAGIEGRAAMAARRRLVEEGKLVFPRHCDSVPAHGVEIAWTIVQRSHHAIPFNPCDSS